VADEKRLTAALADYRKEFDQRRWRTSERFWSRSKMAFIRAKKKHARGTDEALVTSRIVEGGRVQARRYVLLHDEEEWRACDQDAFEGYLEDGPCGLKRGKSRHKRTFCNCGRRIHRSSGRAWNHAKWMARQYGKSGVQRPYQCPENPRAVHLTAQRKGSRELIPDAYI
jgi:hypothetical protein